MSSSMTTLSPGIRRDDGQGRYRGLSKSLWTVLVLIIMVAPARVQAYPIDGYADTGIRRIEGVRRIEGGTLPGRKQPPGAVLPTAAVDLRLLDYPDMELPEPDPAFTKQVLGLLGQHASQYGIAVLDLSSPEHPRYAEYRGDSRQNVGSVGKLVVVLGLFQALADAFTCPLTGVA